MLDQSILRSRPRPPARKSFSQRHRQPPLDQQPSSSHLPPSNHLDHHDHHHHHHHHHPTQSDLPLPLAHPSSDHHHHLPLNDSPLSQVAKLLQHPSTGPVEFKSCGSFIEAWSIHPDHHLPQSPSSPSDDHLLPTPHPASDPPYDPDHPNSITHEWVSAKTREELEALLLAADRVIRERERDLGIAASIGKSLLENNIALRARQQKLLERVASSSTSSPTRDHRPFDDVTNRSEYIEARPPPSPSDYEPHHHLPFQLTSKFDPSSSSSSHPPPKHSFLISSDEPSTPAPHPRFPYCFRPESSPPSTISSPSSDPTHLSSSNPPQMPSSASPATLHRLAEQNDHLAEQLADLQAETAESELEGRKRLRKLVKELETLRADLRHTEERNALLEEERLARLEHQNHEDLGHMVDEIVGDMKRVMMEDHHPPILKTYTPTRIIHPSPQLASSTAPEQTPPAPKLSLSPSPHPRSHSSFLSVSSKSSSISNLSRSSPEFQTSPKERALVAQLLAKIAELKETQNEFDQEREEMKAKLRRAREEVEQLQVLVEDAESELQQFRKLGWEDRSGLIGWDGSQNPATESSSNRAPGNRKMINQSRKAKKRQWPAQEYYSGSVSSQATVPDSNLSITSATPDHEPVSPSMRGQALSMARSNSGYSNGSQENDPKRSGPRRSQIYSQSSLRLMSDVEQELESLSQPTEVNLSKSTSPIRTLLSEIRGLYPNESNPELRFRNHEPSHEDLESSILHSSSSVSSDRKYDCHPPPGSVNLVTHHHVTYTEFQQAVAETPLDWADDHLPDDLSTSNRVTSNDRKRDSTEWLYRGSSTSSASHYVQSWSATSSTTLGLMSASRPKAKVDSLIRSRQHLLLMGRRERSVHRFRTDGGSSTISSSTTIGRTFTSDRTTIKSDDSPGVSFRRTSRRQEALRRLGIPSSEATFSCEGSDDSGSERRRRTDRAKGEGEEQDEEEEEEKEEEEEEEGNDEDGRSQEADWNYIDSTDHDHRAQGSSGTDYYPLSIRARNTPTMVANRLQAKGSSWGTFVYQWMKLVSVVGLAVGWAVWQGPRQAMEDDESFDHPHRHESFDDEDDEEHEVRRVPLRIEDSNHVLRGSRNQKAESDSNRSDPRQETDGGSGSGSSRGK